jgi:hypothetical protein
VRREKNSGIADVKKNFLSSVISRVGPAVADIETCHGSRQIYLKLRKTCDDEATKFWDPNVHF